MTGGIQGEEPRSWGVAFLGVAFLVVASWVAAIINRRTISSGKGFVHCSLTELNMANSAYFHLVKNSINYKLLIFFRNHIDNLHSQSQYLFQNILTLHIIQEKGKHYIVLNYY